MYTNHEDEYDGDIWNIINKVKEHATRVVNTPVKEPNSIAMPTLQQLPHNVREMVLQRLRGYRITNKAERRDYILKWDDLKQRFLVQPA